MINNGRTEVSKLSPIPIKESGLLGNALRANFGGYRLFDDGLAGSVRTLGRVAQVS